VLAAARDTPGPINRRGHPPAPATGLVPRARLVRRLLEADAVPLVVVVAPAGYGKTTVLSQWAEHDPRPFAWIRLDSRHDDPGDLIASIGDTLELGTPIRTVADLAERVPARPHPFVLVVEDVQSIHGMDAFAVLGAIAEAMPPGSQLAIATRREPALPLGRLRAHRKLLELRTADLAMGRSEAAALLDVAGLRVDRDELDSVLTRTEGWPAGLYLAALSLRGEPDVGAALDRFAGDDRIVAEYMHDELLGSLREEQVGFLRRTSVLDTMSGAICDAVLDTTGSGAALAELAHSGALLVSLDRADRSYRLHRLFAEMLRAELHRVEPELEAELHRRASALHVAHGQIHPAIRHAVAAGDVNEAGHLLWEHAPARIAHGGDADVRRWLGEFSPGQIAAHAPLALGAAASSLAAGDRQQVERWTASAARSIDAGPLDGSNPMRAALTILRAATGVDGVAQMGADAASVARAEPADSSWRAIGTLLEGVAHHLAGRRDEARPPLEEGGRGGAAAQPNLQALCLAQLALLAAEDDDWDHAAILTARARSQVKASELEGYPTMSLVFATSGLVRAHRGMVDEARGDLLRSRRLLDQLVDFAPWYEAETRIVLARADLRLGDVTTARAWLSEAAHAVAAIPDAPTLRAWVEETRIQLETATRSAGETCSLTTAELRVLQLLPTHLSFPAIAKRLYVSPNTVKTHARAVYRKLDASSRGQAVTHASAAGLLG
jgi:LuxR family transcriptional regulator, maltose regulon positive regulatory protein